MLTFSIWPVAKLLPQTAALPDIFITKFKALYRNLNNVSVKASKAYRIIFFVKISDEKLA